MILAAETASGFYYWFEPSRSIISESRPTRPIFDKFSGLVAFRAWMIVVKFDIAMAQGTLPWQFFFVLLNSHNGFSSQ